MRRTDGRMDEGGNLTTDDGHSLHARLGSRLPPSRAQGAALFNFTFTTRAQPACIRMKCRARPQAGRRTLPWPRPPPRRPLPCAHSAIAIRQKRHIQSTPLLRPRLATTTDALQPTGLHNDNDATLKGIVAKTPAPLARFLFPLPSPIPPSCLPACPGSRHQVAGFLRFVQKWCHSLKPPPRSLARSLGPSRSPLPVLVANGVGGKEEGGGRI